VIAFACCTRRGRQINYAEVTVRSEGGKELAQGLVTVSVSGTRELESRRSHER
jgi:acyl-coenzyme A thioesterase PaaI-like protein